MKRIVAACGFRYDAELVPDMIENLKGIVDDVVLMDDRGHDNLWRNEHEYRLKIRKLAIEAGADWIYITSPDERLEKGAGSVIRKLVEENDEAIIQFHLRELFEPNRYRVDGLWGEKTRLRLYPIKPGQEYKKNPIQCSPFPVDKKGLPLYKVINSDLNIYHLKMINPANRKLRAQIFNKLDPERKFQSCGYDYLDDEKGKKLVKIPPERMYLPKYTGYEFKVPAKYL